MNDNNDVPGRNSVLERYRALSRGRLEQYEAGRFSIVTESGARVTCEVDAVGIFMAGYFLSWLELEDMI